MVDGGGGECDAPDQRISVGEVVTPRRPHRGRPFSSARKLHAKYETSRGRPSSDALTHDAATHCQI